MQNKTKTKSGLHNQEVRKNVDVRFEKKTGQFFLVFTGDKAIKVAKGSTEETVNELLGKKYKIEKTQDKYDQKRIYQFGQARHIYKVLLRGGQLEWIMKASQ